MVAPAIQSVLINGTQVTAIFDRLITAANATGFTATLQPAGTVQAITFTDVVGNALRFTVPSVLTVGQSLSVAYTTGAIRDQATGLDPATPFTRTAVAEYVVPQLISAVAGLGGANRIVLQFNTAVAPTAGNPVAGFTLTVNAAPVTGTITGSFSADQTQLTLTLPSNIPYNAPVLVAYSGGQLATQGAATTAVAAFSVSALNVSTDGLPNSAYPLSTILKVAPYVKDSVVYAEIQVSLNPIDRDLMAKYGPISVATGGTFGITVGNPNGVYAIDRAVPIVDGASIKQTFTATQTTWAVDAAKDWLNVISGAVGQALGVVRSTNTAVGPLTQSTIQV